MIKFNQHNITNGADKARVHYSVDNRIDGRKCVTIYPKDYGRVLGCIFADEYENQTDLQTDYFDKGKVVLFEGHPLYAQARECAIKVNAAFEARQAIKNAKRKAAATV